MDKIATVAKAVAGAATALAAALGVAYTDGTVTPAEWITIVVAAALGFVGVWAAPANRSA